MNSVTLSAGWIGSFLLAICAAPQAWLSIRQGHARGITAGLLWLWFFGELLTLIYIVAKPELDVPLFANYAANIVLVSIVIKYKYVPRNEALASPIKWFKKD